MNRFLLVVVVVGLFSLTPRSTRAQACCGTPEPLMVSCPFGCGETVLYSCFQFAGDTYMPPVHAQCGHGTSCSRVSTYAFASSCDDLAALLDATGKATSASAETTAYENVYVRDCAGTFVAVRIATERGTA
jgi:hypothetical protein